MFRLTAFPKNTKHLHNIYTMLDQRLRRWADVVQMLYKYFVCAGLKHYTLHQCWFDVGHCLQIIIISNIFVITIFRLTAISSLFIEKMWFTTILFCVVKKCHGVLPFASCSDHTMLLIPSNQIFSQCLAIIDRYCLSLRSLS